MGWDGWIDGMVIIGQWSSKSTFGAIKVITLFWEVFCWGLSFILLGHLNIHWDHLTTSSIFFFDSDKDKDIGTDLVYYWHSWHFLTNWETLIMTLRFSDWQSESDLESFVILAMFCKQLQLFINLADLMWAWRQMPVADPMTIAATPTSLASDVTGGAL